MNSIMFQNILAYETQRRIFKHISALLDYVRAVLLNLFITMTQIVPRKVVLLSKNDQTKTNKLTVS